jgi:hypothetical protein
MEPILLIVFFDFSLSPFGRNYFSSINSNKLNIISSLRAGSIIFFNNVIVQNYKSKRQLMVNINRSNCLVLFSENYEVLSKENDDLNKLEENFSLSNYPLNNLFNYKEIDNMLELRLKSYDSSKTVISDNNKSSSIQSSSSIFLNNSIEFLFQLVELNECLDFESISTNYLMSKSNFDCFSFPFKFTPNNYSKSEINYFPLSVYKNILFSCYLDDFEKNNHLNNFSSNENLYNISRFNSLCCKKDIGGIVIYIQEPYICIFDPFSFLNDNNNDLDENNNDLDENNNWNSDIAIIEVVDNNYNNINNNVNFNHSFAGNSFSFEDNENSSSSSSFISSFFSNNIFRANSLREGDFVRFFFDKYSFFILK